MIAGLIPLIALQPVLLAADWVGIVIWLVVISIGIINQLLGDKKKQPPKRPNVPPPVEKPQGAAKGLLDEVERFLQEARKATEQAHTRPPQVQVTPQQLEQKRVKQQQKAAQRAAAQRKQQQKGAKGRGQQQPTRGGLAERHLQSTLERSSEEETFRGSVAEHVAEHLDTRRFDERASRLSHLQQTVERDIGSHVQSVFDHQVGTLGGKPTVQTTGAEPVAGTPAAQIAALLRDPQSLRNMVILQEIMRPPADRW